MFSVSTDFCCIFETLRLNDSEQIATPEIYNMEFESSGEDAVANAYSYTFSSQLNNLSGGQPIDVSGSFNVTDDGRHGTVYDVKVTANGVNFTSGFVSIGLTYPYDSQYAVHLSGSSPKDTIDYIDFRYSSPNATSFSSVEYSREFIDNTASPVTRTFTNAQSSNVLVNSVAVCFTSGTCVRTLRGEVAVEDLRVGDHAVTASGALRPIVWIGHRRLEADGPVLPPSQQPVRIRAGAFGPGLPVRDLRLSPGHPVLVGADADGAGGHLVPIMCLINGTTIAREPVASATYWHVELDSHDILLAEGLPAESYLDWGDRPFFDEASDHALHNPDFVVPGLAARCRPVAVDGPVVEAERARLSGVFAAALGEACAWDEAERFAWIAA
ncbi:Hint domain-containing protein [Methylobacterium tarhaniae]|uniref:Hint domain-containing protein n=1 Tax=Methylobacterium tarhaniae TaxID=1187852 RepID=UPI003CFFA9F0